MEVVTGATNSLLPKLGALLQDEYNLQAKVRKDIESLQMELLFMKATLNIVAEVPRDQLDEHVRIWAVFIKELSYDMEDVVNSFMVRVHHAWNLDGLIRKVFNMLCLGTTHHEIAGMVKEIKSLINEVGELRERYRVVNIDTRPTTPVVVLPQRDDTFVSCLAHEDLNTCHHVDINQNLVGVDKDMGVLQNWITSSNDHRVLSIIGPGGVGKTTISIALYRNCGDQFDRRAMVNVSQHYNNSGDVTTVLVDILSQVKPQGPQEVQGHDRSISDIVHELHMNLGGLSYLLLFEDVFSASIWEKLKNSLPKSIRGSRVIVTTRFQAVASACIRDKGDHVHEVLCLSDEKAKELFLAESHISRQSLRNIPPRLWEMCGGLPMAVVAMAGHAACNPDRQEDEWKKVCSSLVPDSSKALTQGFTRILSHCYNDMPSEIKTCSLYVCIFPKGEKISRKRLTRRLLAEGFVSEKDGLSVEDVAEIYVNHLVRRKIIRVVEQSSNGKVKSYQVHNMVLDYIVSKASEENFVTVVGGHRLMVPPSNKVRRLSLQGSDSKHKKAMGSMNFSHVRSLTLFGRLAQLPSNSLKFGIVQVLDLEGCKDFKKQHAKEICKMLLLKYLNLRRTEIDKIPKKIRRLQFLETIDIRETNVTELPNAVCQLERLVTILGGNKRTRKALKLPEALKKKTMKSMRILSGIEIVEGSATAVADFHHLTDLRKLAIYKLNITNGGKLFRELSSSIEYLGGYSLHTLIIHDDSSEFLKSLSALSSPPKFLKALDLSGKLTEHPEWITELDSLTKLTLSVTLLTTDALQRLSKLQKLFSLTFSPISEKHDPETTASIEEIKAHSDGEIMVPAGGFGELMLLRLSTPLLPLLRFSYNAMPKLERLELRFRSFQEMYGIGNLHGLKELHLRVHDEAGDVTKFIMDDMATAAREAHEGPRIIVDQYHE